MSPKTIEASFINCQDRLYYFCRTRRTAVYPVAFKNFKISKTELKVVVKNKSNF